LHILTGSSNETLPTPSDGTHNVSSIAVEEDTDEVEVVFTAINEGSDTGIKQEEGPEDISFPDIKTEPDEVSHVYVCS
jgi:hypothetical protein